MTVEEPTYVAAETSTLEVRWILAGTRPDAMVEWFGRLPKRMEWREDTYLVAPRLEGLSVKLRGDAMLEFKLQKGSAGLFEVPGLATGSISSWHKWSFPIGSQSQHVSRSSDWRRVRKHRRISWFSPTGQAIPPPDPGADDPSGCIVELTDITVGGEAWWTLGFEATGSDPGRRGAIQATAAVVVSGATAEGVELRVDDSLPYSTWLTHQ